MSNYRPGPGVLVAAAFIGPGTVTICTLAGVQTGYSLLWAILFSMFATLVLQELAARIGWHSGRGLGEAIHSQLPRGWIRICLLTLVAIAILVGNAAYEAGNIAGAVLGIEILHSGFAFWPLLIGVLAFVSLWQGHYLKLQKFLIALVVLMSLCFLVGLFMVKPNLVKVIQGLIPGRINGSDLLLVIALIGTTVVPYNLFLHAAALADENAQRSLNEVRLDSAVAIIIGGLISMSIIILAAATQTQGEQQTITSVTELASSLEPVLGGGATVLLAIGLFAAGLTSAITAPLAAAYAARGIFNWQGDLRSGKLRAVWILVLATGVLFASLAIKPIALIKSAQIANGLLLPIMVLVLLYLANQKNLLEKHTNKAWQNLLTGLVLLITLLLSARTLNSVFGWF